MYLQPAENWPCLQLDKGYLLLHMNCIRASFGVKWEVISCRSTELVWISVIFFFWCFFYKSQICNWLNFIYDVFILYFFKGMVLNNNVNIF